jgi:L-lactate utilization protein LutB
MRRSLRQGKIRGEAKKIENQSADETRTKTTFSQTSAAIADNTVDYLGKIVAVRLTMSRGGRINLAESTDDAIDHEAEIETPMRKVTIAAVIDGEIGLDHLLADDGLDHLGNRRVSIGIDHPWKLRKTANGRMRKMGTPMSWKI